MKTYNVHLTFKHPAWNTKDGIDYTIKANTKAEAIKYARRQASDYGETGVIYFKATEQESQRFYGDSEINNSRAAEAFDMFRNAGGFN